LKYGHLSEDVHKSGRPKVPKFGGASAPISISIVCLIFSYLLPELSVILQSYSISVALGGLVGALDDALRLGGKSKPVLAAVPALPLIAYGAYSGRPFLPMVGRARLTLVTPLALLPYMSIMANASNMIDALNGLLPSALIVALCAICIEGAVLGSAGTVMISLISIGALLAYLCFNRFPARTFAGNVGSFGIGVAAAAAAVPAGLEMMYVISTLPMMVSGFFTIATMGFREKSERRARPILVTEDALLEANPDPSAPLTLIPMLTLTSPKSEPRVVAESVLLFAFSSVLSLLTFVLTLWR